MTNAQWVKPLTPDMIPAGYFAEWNYTTQEWDYIEKPPNFHEPDPVTGPISIIPTTPDEKLNRIGLSVAELKTALGIS